MNSYLLESLDSLSLEEERNHIIQEVGMTDISINSYDMEEVSLDSALEDLDTYGLFSSKKIIVIRNIESLKYDDYSESFDHLFQYIKNPNPDYLLIIEVKKLNNTTKVAKNLKKLCEYRKVDLDLKKLIQEELKGYKITPKTISFFIEYCENDFTKIMNECKKLKDYKNDEKSITEEDIREIVVKKLGDSKDLTFAFTRSLAMKDKAEALKQYHDLLSYQIEPLSIIGLLASQIRIIYQVKLLENRHLRDKEIAELLEEKSDYRIKKTRELTRLYSEEELLLLMQKLSEIDYQIKTSDVDGNSLIELFIINL